jgi:hypothetical protein
MKKLLLTAAAIVATLNMYGQGTGVISFGNVNTTNTSRIYVNQDGSAAGTLAAGTGYKIALYWGNRGTPEAGLVQAGAAANFALGQGMFSGGNRTLNYTTGSGNGDIVTVQARAWATIVGVPDTYEAVLAAGLAGDQRAQVAKGPVFEDDTYRPADPTDPATAIGTHAGWRGFGISPVPEPSVIGLGLLGAGALLMLRRRK